MQHKKYFMLLLVFINSLAVAQSSKAKSTVHPQPAGVKFGGALTNRSINKSVTNPINSRQSIPPPPSLPTHPEKREPKLAPANK